MSKLYKFQIIKLEREPYVVYARVDKGSPRRYEDITLSSIKRLSSLTYHYDSQAEMGRDYINVFIWKV